MRALAIFLTIVGIALIIIAIPACDLVVVPGVLGGNLIARMTFSLLLICGGAACLMVAAGIWKRLRKQF